MLYFWHFFSKNFLSQSKKPSLHWNNPEHAFMSELIANYSNVSKLDYLVISDPKTYIYIHE